MKRLFTTCLTAILTVLLLAACDANVDDAGTPRADPAADSSAPLLLVSIDGLRHDYLDRYEAPTLTTLAAEGTFIKQVEHTFPTKTFPNHYTIATGLHPTNHGIISNNMYDDELGRFSLSNREAVQDGRWWEGEPIWVTAETQGLTCHAFFWPGTEAEINGVRPTEWFEYDGSIPGDERVDQILAWLDLPAEARPDFMTLYFSTVDSRGHRYGPEHANVGRALAEVDAHMQRLLDGLDARGLSDALNMLIVSDHGMSPTSQERVIILDDYIDLDDVFIVDYSPVAMMNVRNGRTTPEALVAALDAAPNSSAYLRADVPAALNFYGHDRIPEVIMIADDTWSISTRSFFEDDPARADGGAHGYDPRLESMLSLAIAHGPAFRAAHTIDKGYAVDFYEAMTAVLGLDPAPNDGSAERARQLMRDE
ncbi:MAG: sulfatase-like hydrolase/transferase [Bacteroidetes bacterium]|jgi:predicted AlkP superfamily pyrophosphatase or phosphodiesterase|nr:sulfatase-like hydrolase/transferase [Bacteroidota bacterium]